MIRGQASCCAATLVVLGGLVCSPALSQVSFSDQTAAAGLGHATALPTDMSQRYMYCGGSVGDFNRDGWPDLFLLGGGDAGTADALYFNNGDGTFTDHAAAWGVQKVHRGRGSTVGDFNNDGWDDIYVTSGGDMTDVDRVGQHMLYRNNGDDTFTDIAVTAGVNQSSTTQKPATGAAFGDYDLDGDLDLYVCGWEGGPSNRLYRNNDDETFSDVTISAGLGQHHHGFSPRFVDMNGDRYPELIVSADYFTSKYYINDGDGTFTDGTVASGTGMESNGMGGTVGDFNRDGLPDWYVTSIYNDSTIQDGNYLYVNQGNHTFTPIPEADGARDGGWGWGVDTLDFDHDGWVDLVETNGFYTAQWQGENSYLFRNNGNMTFSEEQGPTSGFEHATQGRTLLLIDYDRDADMDLVFTGWDEPVALFRNDVSGADTHSIEIALDASGSSFLPPQGYGAKITATAGGVSQYAWPNGGSTYLGRSQMVTHFGLGAETSVDLTVQWSNGLLTTAAGVAADQIVTLGPPVAGAPGEASGGGAGGAGLMKAHLNRTTGLIEVEYTPSCNGSNHTIYYGDLANVSTYGYTGAACWRGNSGLTSFDPSGLTSAFFLIVGNTGLLEGSYGTDRFSTERPIYTAGACPLPQDLSAGCGLP
jgi:hypothetical protein